VKLGAGWILLALDLVLGPSVASAEDHYVLQQRVVADGSLQGNYASARDSAKNAMVELGGTLLSAFLQEFGDGSGRMDLLFRLPAPLPSAPPSIPVVTCWPSRGTCRSPSALRFWSPSSRSGRSGLRSLARDSLSSSKTRPDVTRELDRKPGFPAVFSISVGVMLGSGIFGLPGSPLPRAMRQLN
jgi:hypothetical protein